MKKIAAMLALCTVLLTGCSTEKQNEETIINSITESVSETAVTTEAATVTETATTAVTEAEHEQEQFRKVYTGDSWQLYSLGDGIVCAPTSECINFVNTDTGEFIVSISIPDDFGSVGKVVKGSGDVLARVICDGYDYSTTPPTYYADAIIVKDDYTYETIYNCEPADVSFEACGHNIAEWGLDIVDTDSGEVIVVGYIEEGDQYGLHTQWNEYEFDIDENRFVYRIGGYESLPGFGIYDFSTGTATTVPESRDLIPKGYHNGKIYSVKTAWDGFGTQLYVTEIETLETEFFMDFPFELNSPYDYIEYYMPENGEYILIYKYAYTDGNNVTFPAQVYKINPDTAEIENMYEFPKEYMFTDSGLMIDDDTFGCISGGLVLIDIE